MDEARLGGLTTQQIRPGCGLILTDGARRRTMLSPYKLETQRWKHQKTASKWGSLGRENNDIEVSIIIVETRYCPIAAALGSVLFFE